MTEFFNILHINSRHHFEIFLKKVQIYRYNAQLLQSTSKELKKCIGFFHNIESKDNERHLIENFQPKINL